MFFFLYLLLFWMKRKTYKNSTRCAIRSNMRSKHCLTYYHCRVITQNCNLSLPKMSLSKLQYTFIFNNIVWFLPLGEEFFLPSFKKIKWIYFIKVMLHSYVRQVEMIYKSTLYPKIMYRAVSRNNIIKFIFC